MASVLVRCVMLALVACSFTAGLAFWSMGAWPIVGFFGIDILLVQLAFRLNYRQARASEEIRVFRDRLTVTSTTAGGETRQADFNPYWARVEVERVRPGTEIARGDVARPAAVAPGERSRGAALSTRWESRSVTSSTTSTLVRAVSASSTM